MKDANLKNLIFLEGPAGTGKSTLARSIREISINGAQTFKVSAANKKEVKDISVRSWSSDLSRLETAYDWLLRDNRINTVIVDRFFLSEFVYGRLRSRSNIFYRAQARKYYKTCCDLWISAWKNLVERQRPGVVPQLFITGLVFSGLNTSKDAMIADQRRKARRDGWSYRKEASGYQSFFPAYEAHQYRDTSPISIRLAPLLLGSDEFQMYQVIQEVRKCQNL